MESIKNLNIRIKSSFGQVLDGRAKYRLVFANEELEIKSGTFHDYYGHIFLRAVTGIRQVKKYNHAFWKDCYVLEYLQMNTEHTTIMSDVRGSYEPIWTFRDGNGNPVPPVWRAIQKIVESHITGMFSIKSRKTQKELDAAHALELKKELLELEEELGVGQEDISTSVNMGEGIFVPRNYER